MAANIISLSPLALESQVYSSQDLSLIQSSTSASYFDPNKDYIEYTISSIDGNYQITDVTYNSFSIYNTPEINSGYSSIDVNVEGDLIAKGFTTGEWTVEYAFYHTELSSSLGNLYYIKEISSDRTEVRLASNTLSNVDIQTGYDEFITKYNNSVYFQDFYLNFGNNNLVIANNLLLDTAVPNYEILINLYEPLSSQFNIKDTLWIVTKVADPLAFRVQFVPELTPPPINYINIKGPNVDIPIKDKINNSSNYVNYEQLLTTGLISSYGQILSYLNDKSINISVDYSNFEDFVHFSSAKARVENFYYKVQLIEQYNSEITTLEIVGSSSITTSNITQLQEKVDNIIKNFDGFEYYQYFTSGSDTYPKGNSTPPYDLFYSLSPEVLTWLGSDEYDSPYYGGLLLNASNYDIQNQDYLINTIPDYLRDDPQNEPYTVFINMIGQHYDNIWIYYKDVNNRYDGDNRLNYGISKDLVADALRSFGLKIYQNNFSTSDLFNAFTGYNFISGSAVINNGNVYVVSPYIDEGVTGYFVDDITTYTPYGELITNYIASPLESAFTPLDNVNKEIYKRLYHNLPYLLKTKGTITGLRALLGVYGIPETILRISEFGGRDRNTSTYDYFYDRYSYALTPDQSASALIPWLPLQRNYIADSNKYILPDSIQFRFKTTGIPESTYYSQSLLLKYNNNVVDTSTDWNLGIFLFTTGSNSNQYDGSMDPYEKYGSLKFYMSGALSEGGYVESPEIFLPFFDGGWWSVMLQRDQHISSSISSSNTTYTLYAANKLYDSNEGNIIGFIGSSSVYIDGTTSSSINNSWNVFTNDLNFVYTNGVNLGGNIAGAKINNNVLVPSNTLFTGSLQEFRYYAYALSESQFRDYTMNPESIEGLNYTGPLSSFDILDFRAPLGNELEDTFTYLDINQTSSIEFNSYHPSTDVINNLLVTESFYLTELIVPDYYNVDNPLNKFKNVSFNSYINLLGNITSSFTSSGGNDFSWSEPGILTSFASGNGDFNINGITIGVGLTFLLTLSSSLQGIITNQTITNPGSPDPYNITFSNIGFSPNEEFVVLISGSAPGGSTFPDVQNSLLLNNLLLYNKSINQYKVFYQSSSVSSSYYDTNVETYYFDQPIAGLKNRTTDKIQIVSSSYPPISVFYTQSGNTLTQYRHIEQQYVSQTSEVPDVNALEVAFSPTNEIDDDIVSSLGYFNIGEYIGDPRQVISRDVFYPDLNKLRDDYFKKYFDNYDLIDYIRLIKFFDNSLFKMIKDFVPARTNLRSGIVIKQHLLERNKYPQPLMEWEDVTYSGSIDTAFFTGSTGGTFNEFNNLNFSQSWFETTIGPTGSTQLLHNDQSEFYNGELPGTTIDPTNGELNEANIFKYPSTLEINYNVFFYNSRFTPIGDFLDNHTTPNQGEVYLWYDSGSTLTPSIGPGQNIPIPGPGGG